MNALGINQGRGGTRPYLADRGRAAFRLSIVSPLKLVIENWRLVIEHNQNQSLTNPN